MRSKDQGVMQCEHNSSTGMKHGAQENLCIAVLDGGISFQKIIQYKLLSPLSEKGVKSVKG